LAGGWKAGRKKEESAAKNHQKIKKNIFWK
jgi:hypothetical protein